MNKGVIQKILGFPFSARQAILRRRRGHLSKSEFAEIISRSGGDAEAANIIYSKLQDWIYIEGFTVHPDDKLDYIFGMAEEELDEDLVLAIINEMNLPVPDDAEINEFGPVETALDVARLIALIRGRLVR